MREASTGGRWARSRAGTSRSTSRAARCPPCCRSSSSASRSRTRSPPCSCCGRRSPRRSPSRSSGSGRTGAARSGCCRRGALAGSGSRSRPTRRPTGSCCRLIVVSGLGVAAFHPEGSKFAAYASGRRRASGMSFFSIGGNFGYALGPLSRRRSCSGSASGRAAARVPGVRAVVVLLAALSFLRGFGRERARRACARAATAAWALAILLGVDRIPDDRLVRRCSCSCRSGRCRSATRRPREPPARGDAARRRDRHARLGPLADRVGRRRVLRCSLVAMPPLILGFVVVGGMVGARRARPASAPASSAPSA